ncbi:MAG: hypothetical protein AAB955_03030 [Patescibacteria group bacterium]
MKKALRTEAVDTHLGLPNAEFRVLKSLNTPRKIQEFLDKMPVNYEKKGETHHSPLMALRARKAHCIEGALLAAAALWLNGKEPLLLDLQSDKGDDDHVLAVYQFNGYWGALSKTNHATIRSRDPVYRSVRELVMSYFHEWFPEHGTDKHAPGTRTLRSYSKPLNMKKFGQGWVTTPKHLWWLDKELNKQPHYPIAPKKNMRLVRIAGKSERIAGSVLEWSKKDKRT